MIPENFFSDIGKLNLKFIWKNKEPRLSKAILKKKNRAGPSAVVFTINWSQPVTDFFVPSPLPLLHLTSLLLSVGKGKFIFKKKKKRKNRASLVVQWIRICLTMQRTWVRSLVWEESENCRAAKPTCHNYWSLRAATTEPVCHNYWSLGVLEPAHHDYWCPCT